MVAHWTQATASSLEKYISNKKEPNLMNLHFQLKLIRQHASKSGKVSLLKILVKWMKHNGHHQNLYLTLIKLSAGIGPSVSFGVARCSILIIINS